MLVVIITVTTCYLVWHDDRMPVSSFWLHGKKKVTQCLTSSNSWWWHWKSDVHCKYGFLVRFRLCCLKQRSIFEGFMKLFMNYHLHHHHVLTIYSVVVRDNITGLPRSWRSQAGLSTHSVCSHRVYSSWGGESHVRVITVVILHACACSWLGARYVTATNRNLHWSGGIFSCHFCCMFGF